MRLHQGCKWHDLTCNGGWDAGEPILAGWLPAPVYAVCECSSGQRGRDLKSRLSPVHRPEGIRP